MRYFIFIFLSILSIEVYTQGKTQSRSLTLHTLEELNQCTHLDSVERIYLYGEKIEAIPENVFKCHNLKFLMIAFCPIKELDERLGNLVKLEHLTIMYTEIKTLPSLICNLKNLKEISLNSNKIEIIPKCFFTLKIEYLDLSDNNYVEIDKEIIRLKNLERLDLSRNNIEKLPDSLFFFEKLKEIELRKNNIKQLPLYYPQNSILSYLNLSCNKIEEIPENFFLPNLEKIILVYNLLKELPQNIFNIKTLQLVQLCGNPINNSIVIHYKEKYPKVTILNYKNYPKSRCEKPMVPFPSHMLDNN